MGSNFTINQEQNIAMTTNLQYNFISSTQLSTKIPINTTTCVIHTVLEKVVYCRHSPVDLTTDVGLVPICLTAKCNTKL